ncbi:MAG: NAD/NADP octopine/nopaline dehydrogenase family protein, partial [bacterium]
PEGSGKSRLGQIWAERVGAVAIHGAEAAVIDPLELEGRPVLLDPARDVLEVGLNNVNPVVHVPGTLLNLGLLETGWFAKVDFYEALVGRVAAVIGKLDEERVRLGAALGYQLLPLEEFDRRSYGEARRVYSVGSVSERWAEAANVPPRYLEEDVPMGLVPLVSVGRMVGVRLRASELMVELACLVQGADYWATGRTVERLGARGVEDLRGEGGA